MCVARRLKQSSIDYCCRKLRGSTVAKNINIFRKTFIKSSNGYNDDLIKYLATDTNLAGFDETANKTVYKHLITTWALSKVNNNGHTLMVDHGHPDLFYVDEVNGQRISGELNDWLSNWRLPPGVTINIIIELSIG